MDFELLEEVQSRLTTLQNENDCQRKQISELQSRIWDDLRLKNELEDTIAEKEKRIAHLERLLGQPTTDQNHFGDQQQIFHALISAQKKCTVEFGTNLKKSSMEELKNTLDARKMEMQTIKGTASRKISEQENKIKELNETINAQRAEIKIQATELKDQRMEMQTIKDSAARTINEHQMKFVKLNDLNTANAQELLEQSELIAQLRVSKKEQKETIKELRAQIETIKEAQIDESAFKDLQMKIAVKDEWIVELTRENFLLETEPVKTCREKNKLLREANTALRKANTSKDQTRKADQKTIKVLEDLVKTKTQMIDALLKLQNAQRSIDR